MTRKKGERELFGIVPQPRMVRPEPASLYNVILALRFSGVMVFRAGRDKHLVRHPNATSSRKVTTQELVSMVRR